MWYLFVILDNVFTVPGIIFIYTFKVINYIELYYKDNFLNFFDKIMLIYNTLFYNICFIFVKKIIITHCKLSTVDNFLSPNQFITLFYIFY